MSPRYLTTGQAATLCSVSPDTVLKWIRSGYLPALQTAGGHHRIAERDLHRVMRSPKRTADDARAFERRQFRYCWEYNGNGKPLAGCRECAVYQMRALRCYEVIQLAPDALHAKVFCKGGCEDCNYFRSVHLQKTNVLIVSDDKELSRTLLDEVDAARFNLEITDCEYACSAVVDRFRPDFAVVDCSLGVQQTRDICKHLSEDPRIPVVRVVLAANDGEFPNECEREVFARIAKPFRVQEINECIEGIHRATDERVG